MKNGVQHIFVLRGCFVVDLRKLRVFLFIESQSCFRDTRRKRRSVKRSGPMCALAQVPHMFEVTCQNILSTFFVKADGDPRDAACVFLVWICASVQCAVQHFQIDDKTKRKIRLEQSKG